MKKVKLIMRIENISLPKHKWDECEYYCGKILESLGIDRQMALGIIVTHGLDCLKKEIEKAGDMSEKELEKRIEKKCEQLKELREHFEETV